MSKSKNKFNQGLVAVLFLVGLACFGLLIAVLIHGKDMALLNPKGLIASEQLKLIKFSAALMLLLAIPALFLFYFFAWRYRETNEKAAYEPNKGHGKFFVFFVWALPSAFALSLALIMWPAAHRLDQHKQIVSANKPLTIQVVAMRWKWLFIYPEQRISTVNYIQVPVNTPLKFELTADETPMSSFWIPQLGGQLYAMTGHSNLLNLMADTPGDYAGSSAEINGAGFADMKFMTHASSREEFDQWVSKTQTTPNVLDSLQYDKLLKPSQNNSVAYFSEPDSGLYGKVLMKYMGSHHNSGSK